MGFYWNPIKHAYGCDIQNVISYSCSMANFEDKC